MFPGVGLPFLARALLSLAQLLPPHHELIQKNLRGLFLRCACDVCTAASAFMHPMKAKPRHLCEWPSRQSMANRPAVNGSRKWRVIWCCIGAPPNRFFLDPENHTAEVLFYDNLSVIQSASLQESITHAANIALVCN